MLDKAKTLGIVIRATTLYDEYFKPDAIDVVPEHRFDATCLPYFEGDYIPGEIENIIRQVKARPVAEASTSSGAQQHDEVMARLGHNLLKMQGNFIVVHLRNRRFAAAVERGEDVSAWREDSDEELVRSKRAKISGKDSAMSADPKLPHSEADTERPSIPSFENTAPELNSDSILEANRRPEVRAPVEPNDATSSRHHVSDHETTDVSGLVVTVPATTFTSVSAGPLSHRDSSASNDETTSDAAPIVASGHATTSHQDPPADALPDSHVPSGGSNAPSNDAGSEDRASDSHLVADSPPSEPVTRISSPPPETSVSAFNESQSLESKDTMTANEASIELDRANTSFRNAEGGLASRSGEHSVDEMTKMVALHVGGYHLDGAIVADTTDDDDAFDSDLFESRQMFLNYCQTTHCQFDELRRAKHSSMMVLFQLHNPTAPKFLQQCGSCYLDITHGIRYHCNDCPDFDLCQDCYEPVTSGLWAKRDARFAHDKTHSFSPIDMERVTGPAPGREDRQNALKAHIDLLEHAGRCSGPPSCTLQNCERMNGLFQHVRSCEVKPKKDCRICSRLLSLCAMHARNCSVRTGACPIPFCDRIRERYTRLRRQQQQMDDRRRRAQNELYHAGES
jgi:E1A/CREB-binding protein